MPILVRPCATIREGALATDLGVAPTGQGSISVDSALQTSRPGVYATGDVARLHSHQVATAVHAGGQAASAANVLPDPPESRDE